MKHIEKILKSKKIKQSEFEDAMEKCDLSDKEYCELVDKIIKSEIKVIHEDDEPDVHVVDYEIADDYYNEDILNQYFHDISTYDLLSREEERVLLKNAKSGDVEAKERLVTSNLKLVAKLALYYSKSGVYYLDLIQDGTIGLITAIDKFDLSTNYKFSTYATWWIKKEIIDALKKKVNMIKIPNYIYLMHKKVQLFEEDYVNEKGKKPSMEETAAALDIKEEDVLKVKKAIEMNMINVKYENARENEDNYDIKDYSTIEEINKEINDLQQKHRVSTLLNKLNSREKKIIEMYYGLSGAGRYTFKEIGNELEISAERVRVLKERALDKLRYAGERMWKQ